MNLAEHEFRALRHTIAARGTARIALLPACILAWAAVAMTVVFRETSPLASVFPLVVLVAGFEAVHALHAGVERIGRYVQVRYEQDTNGPRWEHTAMAVGPALPGGGVDPLFTTVFVAALVTNFATGAFNAPALPALFAGLLHALALGRILRARRAAARQRTSELARISEFLAPSGQNNSRNAASLRETGTPRAN